MRVPSLPADFTPSQQGRQSAKCAFFFNFFPSCSQNHFLTKKKKHIKVMYRVLFFRLFRFSNDIKTSG